MSYSDLVTADQRLAILQILAGDPGYSHNERVVKAAMAETGHRISSDKIRAELRYLEDVGCLHIEAVVDDLLVATLTERGSDVASGIAPIDGIARPRPGR